MRRLISGARGAKCAAIPPSAADVQHCNTVILSINDEIEGMSEDHITMSIRGYASHADVDRKTIRRQIAKGVIKLDAAGRIDPAQADASWGRVRLARSMKPESDAGRRSATARVAAGIGRLRLAKDRLDVDRERYIERAEALRYSANEADFFVAELRRWPRRHAAAFAEQLGIDDATARRILTRFVASLLTEAGDLRAEAIRRAEAS